MNAQHQVAGLQSVLAEIDYRRRALHANIPIPLGVSEAVLYGILQHRPLRFFGLPGEIAPHLRAARSDSAKPGTATVAERKHHRRGPAVEEYLWGARGRRPHFNQIG